MCSASISAWTYLSILAGTPSWAKQVIANRSRSGNSAAVRFIARAFSIDEGFSQDEIGCVVVSLRVLAVSGFAACTRDMRYRRCDHEVAKLRRHGRSVRP